MKANATRGVVVQASTGGPAAVGGATSTASLSGKSTFSVQVFNDARGSEHYSWTRALLIRVDKHKVSVSPFRYDRIGYYDPCIHVFALLIYSYIIVYRCIGRNGILAQKLNGWKCAA